MPIETYTRNVQSVIDYVNRQFGDDAGIQIDSSAVISWINAGQRQIVQDNPTVNEVEANTNIVAGQRRYPIASDPAFARLQNIHTVLYDGAPLKAISFQEAIDSVINGSNEDEAGAPYVWYMKVGVLHLYPVPSTNITGGLSIYFTRAPADITSTGDMLGIPDNYYNDLIRFVMQQAYKMDENFQAASVEAQEYQASVNKQANQTVVQHAEFFLIQPDPEDYT